MAVYVGYSGRTRTYNPSVNSRISRRSCANPKMEVLENRTAIAVKLCTASHSFQEKFVQFRGVVTLDPPVTRSVRTLSEADGKTSEHQCPVATSQLAAAGLFCGKRQGMS